MGIDHMTIGDAREIVKLFGQESNPGPGPWVIGQAYFIRTGTNYLTGKLAAVYGNELVFTDAAWIASTGRFTQAMNTGILEEVEPYPREVIVNRQFVVDATEWSHPLPREQK